VDIRLLEGAKEDLRNAWFFYERQAQVWVIAFFMPSKLMWGCCPVTQASTCRWTGFTEC
jgi:hypothetical protein